MVLLSSKHIPLGTEIPSFKVIDVASEKVIDHTFGADKPLVVAFMCNHCPYVTHMLACWVDFVGVYQQKGIVFLVISSNDAGRYPQDGPERMKELAVTSQFSFPYAYDEKQDAARAFQAVCTPDFYVYDQNRCLYYHGRFDGSSPGGEQQPTGNDFSDVLDRLLSGNPTKHPQQPSQGCSIKWKE